MKNRIVTRSGNQSQTTRHAWLFGPRAKILPSTIMILIVGIAVWQHTSPQMIPLVGNRYSTSTLYADRGNRILLETMSQGRVFIAISISNLTFPRTWLQTTYSLIVSDVNETVSASYLRGFGLKVTALSIQDTTMAQLQAGEEATSPMQHKLKASSISAYQQFTS